MKKPVNKILQLVDDASCISQFKSDDWNLLISQARLFDLLPFVHNTILETDFYHLVPVEIKQLLDGYVSRLEYLKTLYLWDLEKIKKLAIEQNYRVVVLKGMAYLLDELGIFQSRNFADIDLLVANSDFKIFEKTLTSNGWHFKELSDYDDQYYRKWSHASPPMTHELSGIELDLHHHIASPLSDVKIDNDYILEDVVEVKSGVFYRLSDTDIILHCANHFIYFDDLHGKFKDLLHIYYMLKQHKSEVIWVELYQRADSLGLKPTLYYMTKLLDYFFIMEFPQEIQNWINSSHNKNPKKALVLYLLRNCLSPTNVDSFKFKLMTSLLVFRYQWTRYPIDILLTHLIRKHLIYRTSRWFTREKRA